jgi:cell division septal protein FtsQ
MVITPGQAAPFGDLPIILGSKLQPSQLKKGTRVGRAIMSLGIQLLKDIRRFDALHGQRLSAIDISNEDNLILWVNEKIEVRISSRNLASQMKKISEALVNVDLDPERVRYIDLRFDDIVIGPR